MRTVPSQYWEVKLTIHCKKHKSKGGGMTNIVDAQGEVQI
jgi:hypothetical protein